jgi:hypothetical protein
MDTPTSSENMTEESSPPKIPQADVDTPTSSDNSEEAPVFNIPQKDTQRPELQVFDIIELLPAVCSQTTEVGGRSGLAYSGVPLRWAVADDKADDGSKVEDDEELKPDEARLSSLPTSERLQQLSIIILHALNFRKPISATISRYLSPRFRSVLKTQSMSTVAGFVGRMRDTMPVVPKFRMEVLNTCADVDWIQDKARVWLTLRTSGLLFEDMGREHVSVVEWQRRKKRGGGWLVERISGIRGGGFHLDDTDVVKSYCYEG